MLECATTLLSGLAAFTALSTALCAFASLWLAIKIHRKAKSDERLVFGPLDHPHATISNPSHYNAVIGCAVFNKSRRKAFIRKVEAFDDSGNRVDIAWADSINHLGNPGEPRSFIGIVDSNNLYIRRNDGQSISSLHLAITHSFCKSPQMEKFDPISDWQ